MSTLEKILEYLEKSGTKINTSDLSTYLKNKDLGKEMFITVPLRVYETEKQEISIKDRVTIVEDDVKELKHNFEIYLKTEFKEESNRVFIEMISKYDKIKMMYMKPNGNYIRYYIVYDDIEYFDFIEEIVDMEIKLEKSYPMLNFEFIHLNISELENTNLKGTFYVYEKV